MIAAPQSKTPEQTARAYASRGIPVFPVDPATKRPRTKRGFHDATTNYDQIAVWWQAEPDSAIGAPTGTRSALWVLDTDVDPDKGIDGAAELDRLAAEHGGMPETLMARTPRGGTHHVFKLNGVPVRSSAGAIAPGVDVRGEGGYVVLPDGRGARRWLNRTTPIEAPEWLYDLLGRAMPERASGARTTTDGDKLEKIPEGRRNSTMTSHAGRFRELGYVEGEILGMLEVINASRCETPMDREELARIARSVCRYEQGNFQLGPDEQDATRRAEYNASMQSATRRMHLNKRSRKLLPVATRMVEGLIEQKRNGTPATDDGLYHVARPMIGGRDWNTGAWEICEATVKNHVAEIVGLKEHIPGFRAEKRHVEIEVPWTDPETGEITTVPQRLPTWVFDYDGTPVEFLTTLAEVPVGEERRGGDRTCRKCGGEIKVKQVEYCPHCEIVTVEPREEPPGSKSDPGGQGQNHDPVVEDHPLPLGADFAPAPLEAWDNLYQRAEANSRSIDPSPTHEPEPDEDARRWGYSP
jgi:hypothetical protein